MARTRSTKAAPAASKTSTDSNGASSRYALASQSTTPSKVFILPAKASSKAHISTLPHPRNGLPARYLVCPDTGIYEFTQISAPKTAPRSWLIEKSPSQPEAKGKEDASELQAEVSTGAELYLASAIDPLFLVLPALAGIKATKRSEEQKQLFLSSDDHFDNLPEDSSHLSHILRCENTRRLMEGRMKTVCDTADAGDETMFRLSETKLLHVLLAKARRMAKAGLPPSMEEKFVRKALEAPIAIQKRDPKLATGGVSVAEEAGSQTSTVPTDSLESQSTPTSTDAATPSESQPSTAATSVTEEPVPRHDVVSAIEASEEILKLQRLRVAFSFICSTYIMVGLATQLEEWLTLADKSSIDFSPLTEYLSKLAKLRAEAIAARSVGDYSRKHGRDEEEDEARAEKKRKLEEEKKRKASESRGVRDLKKVNTKGMNKMSDFFKKK